MEKTLEEIMNRHANDMGHENWLSYEKWLCDTFGGHSGIHSIKEAMINVCTEYSKQWKPKPEPFDNLKKFLK